MHRFIGIVVVIITVGICLFLINRHDLPPNDGEIFNNFYGTNAFTMEPASEGKKLFNSKCASCHKLDKNMIGPALRGIAKKYDSLVILKFLHGEKTKITNEGYDYKCINFPELTDQDISNLLSYTN